MRGSIPAIALLLVFALISTQHAQAQQSCRVSYSGSSSRPLLFGGVVDSCQGFRCQNRNDFWGQKCGARDASSWGVCTFQQAQQALEFAKKRIGWEGVNLNPCDFVQYLQGRTLWLLGDSHTKTLFTALECFLIDFWDHQICAPSPDEGAVDELANLPKVKGYSNCIHLLTPGGGRVCIVEVVLGTSLLGNNQIAEGGVLPLLRKKFAQQQDIFYINFGAWHRKNNADWATFIPALEALGSDFQQNKDRYPHMLFRENAAIHPKDMDNKVCLRIEGYNYQHASGRLEASAAAEGDENTKFTMGRPLTELVHSVLPRYGIPIVNSFNYTVPLHGQHIEMRHVGDLDCIHYCHPGVPQMWIWDLFTAFKSGQAGIQPIKIQSRAPTWGGFGNNGAAAQEQVNQPANNNNNNNHNHNNNNNNNNNNNRGGATRFFEALRMPWRIGRRLAEQQEEHQPVQEAAAHGPRVRILQAQNFVCARSKVTF